MALPPFLLPGLPRNTVATSVAPPHRISHAEVPEASQPGTLIPLASVQGEPCGRLLSQDSDALRIQQALEKDGEAVSPSVFYKSWPPSLHLLFLFSSDTFNTHSSLHTPHKTSTNCTSVYPPLIRYLRPQAQPLGIQHLPIFSLGWLSHKRLHFIYLIEETSLPHMPPRRKASGETTAGGSSRKGRKSSSGRNEPTDSGKEVQEKTPSPRLLFVAYHRFRYGSRPLDRDEILGMAAITLTKETEALKGIRLLLRRFDNPNDDLRIELESSISTNDQQLLSEVAGMFETYVQTTEGAEDKCRNLDGL